MYLIPLVIYAVLWGRDVRKGSKRIQIASMLQDSSSLSSHNSIPLRYYQGFASSVSTLVYHFHDGGDPGRSVLKNKHCRDCSCIKLRLLRNRVLSGSVSCGFRGFRGFRFVVVPRNLQLSIRKLLNLAVKRHDTESEMHLTAPREALHKVPISSKAPQLL